MVAQLGDRQQRLGGDNATAAAVASPPPPRVLVLVYERFVDDFDVIFDAFEGFFACSIDARERALLKVCVRPPHGKGGAQGGPRPPFPSSPHDSRATGSAAARSLGPPHATSRNISPAPPLSRAPPLSAGKNARDGARAGTGAATGSPSSTSARCTSSSRRKVSRASNSST